MSTVEQLSPTTGFTGASSSYTIKESFSLMNRNLKTLDLHNISHTDAGRLVVNFLMINDMPVQIITGKSEQMRGIAVEIIEKYDFGYHYELFSNVGCVIVTDNKWTK